ncbi:hypothetical protein CVT26_007969 [Gymnopilus dilepis]|uniref:Uncharacterized protein n=1 Tax=Gymnopilus dilepis TaxID=231916 RepID=A0A409W0G2_9AGAR|nr:hypothetical protein CVT26_007969 [Gymnopilus dilepis]
MPPGIEKCLENNDNPSASVTAEIKALISDPLQALSAIEQEIKSTELAMKAFEDECQALRKSTSEYDQIRVPIRRLPPDVLDEIFFHCLATHRNPVISIEEAPLLLTTVCRSWRSAVLSSPRLWSRLHIAVGIPNHPSSWDRSWECERDRGEILANLDFRQQALGIWLSRSASCLLSISLDWIETDPFLFPRGPGDPIGDWSSRPTSQIFNTILSTSSRIAEFELSMPCNLYSHSSLFDTSPQQFPVLRRLRISFVRSRAPQDISDPIDMPILRAPNLRSLSVGPSTKVFRPFSDASWMEGLRSLSLRQPITTIAAAALFRRCHRLQLCRLCISNQPLSNVQSEIDEVIFLPNLLTLELFVDFQSDPRIPSLYKNLHAPHLEHFIYGQYFDSFQTPPMGFTSPPQPTVCLFLERCPSLTKLTMNSTHLSTEAVVHILRSVSQISHLRVGPSRTFRRCLPCADPMSPFWMSRSNQQSIDLNILILSTRGENLKGKVRAQEVLLPNLEVFKGHAMGRARPRGRTTTDQEVKDFILSRLGEAAAEIGVSQLKRVEMTFARHSESDVVNEVRAKAREVGSVDLELDILYDPPNQVWLDWEKPDVYSPSHGLDHWDTWNTTLPIFAGA